jgi:L-Ala-D/L-Glu epimerase
VIRLQSVEVERWPVAGAFVISRGAKTHVDVVVCTISDGTYVGRGEGTPIYYHGETAEGCAEIIRTIAGHSEAYDREALRRVMAPGAARNALDCALWDLEAQRAGQPVWVLAGLPEPKPLPTAFTISLDAPEVMAEAARAAAARGFTLLKCKLTGEGDRERVAAVAAGAPDTRLIVDANESWAGLDLVAEATALQALGVTLIEQPLPAVNDRALAQTRASVPFCADESCQSLADMADLRGYQAINIKLDKAGGLTEALAIARAAREQNLRIMVGCMLATSLGIAPAFLLGQLADWVDLDGALLLARDREGGLEADSGMMKAGNLWGLCSPAARMMP